MDEIGEDFFDKNWSGHAMNINVYIYTHIHLFVCICICVHNDLYYVFVHLSL